VGITGFAINITAKDMPVLQSDPAAKRLRIYILTGWANMQRRDIRLHCGRPGRRQQGH
jgi:hypothetical protein